MFWEEQVFATNISSEVSVEETGGSIALDESSSEFVFEELPNVASEFIDRFIVRLDVEAAKFIERFFCEW